MNKNKLHNCAINFAALLAVIFSVSLCPRQSSAVSPDTKNDEHPTASIKFSEILEKKQVTEIIEEFQIGLNHKGFNNSHITSCAHVMEYVAEDIGGHDYSYGAICTVASGATFMMCDDVLIGKFTLNKVNAPTQDKLKDFIHDNCPPGG